MNFMTRRASRFRRFGATFPAVVGLCLLLAGCSGGSSHSTSGGGSYSNGGIVSGAPKPAPKLEVPKVYAGPNFFEKREIFRYEKTKKEIESTFIKEVPKDGRKPRPEDPDAIRLNRIGQVFGGEIDAEPGVDILAAGYRKAFVLDLDGKVKKVIDYDLGRFLGKEKKDYGLSNARIIDVDDDGKVEILGFGEATVILNLDGKLVWKYDGGNPNAINVGDLDGNGKNEVVVAIQSRIEIFDLRGQKLQSFEYSKSANNRVTNVLPIADFDGDRKSEIFAYRTVFRADGEKVKEIGRPLLIHGIAVRDDGKPFFLEFNNSRLDVFDAGDLLVGSYDAPLSAAVTKSQAVAGYSLHRAEAWWVQLITGEEKHLAVLAEIDDEAEFGRFRMLYVYDSKKRLIYQEAIQALSSEISVLPNGDGTESLLITDDGKLNLYKVK
jgi:hypothetical protein